MLDGKEGISEGASPIGIKHISELIPRTERGGLCEGLKVKSSLGKGRNGWEQCNPIRDERWTWGEGGEADVEVSDGVIPLG